MVKVSAPAMSLDASGSLAGALVFSKWKGRNYVRQHVIPANPKKPGQVGIRAMFKFLSQVWVGLSAANHATWESRADDMVVSTFNAFMSLNVRRWRDFDGPTKEDPPTLVGTPPTGPTGVATPNVRSMTIVITDGVTPPDFAYAIFRSLTGVFSLNWDNCIAVVPWDVGGTTEYVDSPLEPDTYYYNAIGYLATGVEGADGTEFDGTIV